MDDPNLSAQQVTMRNIPNIRFLHGAAVVPNRFMIWLLFWGIRRVRRFHDVGPVWEWETLEEIPFRKVKSQDFFPIILGFITTT